MNPPTLPVLPATLSNLQGARLGSIVQIMLGTASYAYKKVSENEPAWRLIMRAGGLASSRQLSDEPTALFHQTQVAVPEGKDAAVYRSLPPGSVVWMRSTLAGEWTRHAREETSTLTSGDIIVTELGPAVPATPPEPSMTISLYDIQQAAVGSTLQTSVVGTLFGKTGLNQWNSVSGKPTNYSDAQISSWCRSTSVLRAPSDRTSELLGALAGAAAPSSTSKDNNMANRPADFSASASETLDMLKEATATGIKAGLASELADRLVETIESKFGSAPMYPALLKTPLGRRGLSYGAPVLLYFLAATFPERIPVNADGVKAAARYAVIGHSVKLIAPLFALLTPLWEELANFAKSELREVK
jgi:hypothetical protein